MGLSLPTTPSLPQATIVNATFLHTADQPKPSPLNPTVNTTLATMEPYPLFETKLNQNQSLAEQIKPRPFKSCLAKITMMPLPFCLLRNPANKKPKPFTGFLMDERKINEKKKKKIIFKF